MSKRQSELSTASPNSDYVNPPPAASTEPSQPDPLDPFEPENLRINPDLLKGGGVKKLLTVVPVRKPRKQEFIRVHPLEKYRLEVALVEIEADRETYIVSPAASIALKPTEYYLANLFLCLSRQEVLFLWPVKLPDPDGRKSDWHVSSQIAAEHAMKEWVNVQADMNLRAYVTTLPQSRFPEPEWPAKSFGEILKIAFRDRIIESPDHLAIQKLRGAV